MTHILIPATKISKIWQAMEALWLWRPIQCDFIPLSVSAIYFEHEYFFLNLQLKLLCSFYWFCWLQKPFMYIFDCYNVNLLRSVIYFESVLLFVTSFWSKGIKQCSCRYLGSKTKGIQNEIRRAKVKHYLRKPSFRSAS